MSNLEAQPLVEPLTERELEVLRLIADGLSNREIAQELVITLGTVKWYNKQIYAKLDVHSRTQAVALARQHGMLDDQPDAPVSPPTPVAARSKHNLPAPVSSFVGRERELAEVKEALGVSRLLTLTGPGGTGKTRLAMRAAADVVSAYPDGVTFVGLASISDPNLVPNAIAHMLGLTGTASSSMTETLKFFLRDRQMLLVLDNYEHLLEAAPLVGDFLAASPGLTVLVTSREALHLYGEHEYPVQPMGLPGVRDNLSPDDLLQYEAIALFVERARAAQPGFRLTEENAALVTEICARLDGLPLAMELAAARLKLFGLDQLRSRLGSQLETLTGGARDLPTRQQTLRSTIDWSYNLLEEAEKQLFARLAVFGGGCTVEAIEKTAGDTVNGDPVDHLASLVDKSLMRQWEGEDGDLRFRMLRTVREYAWERLAEGGEEEAQRRQHAAYFVALAERAAPELRGARQEIFSKQLEAEHDNLRAALQWTLSGADPELGLRLVGALRDFWYYEAHHIEGQRWTDHALEYAEDVSPGVRAKAFLSAGQMAFAAHDHATGKLIESEALKIYRELGNAEDIAWALIFLAGQSMGEPGEYEEAIARAEEGVSLFRELDDKVGLAQGLNIIGELARVYGDDVRARAAYEESLELSVETGEKRRQAMILYNLGFLAMHAHDPEEAEACVSQALALSVEMNWRWGMVDALIGMAGPASEQGQPERAARLMGAAETLLGEIGAQSQPGDKLEYERYEAAVRDRLDEDAFEKAWAEGREMTLEEAVAFALGDVGGGSRERS